ncbi:MAG: LysR family transcriptional regulator [Polaromonas sp.]|nr:LysR family transcriptional regulator [Polaromonas sp.]
MSIDRYRAMEVFTRVVEAGSFTAAAAALHLPKGRVTTLVQELEAHLGVRLLNRTTRRLSLTDDGALYHQRALAMVQEMAELEGALRQSVATPAGRLRVDMPAAVGRHVIGPALPGFFALYPDMVLDIGSSDRPVDLVAEGVDCVIRGGLVHDDTLVARPLGSMPVVTCAAPSYLARWGTPLTLEDLAAQNSGQGHRFLNFHSAKTGKVFPFDFARGGDVRQVSRPHWVSCSDAGAYQAAGLAGMGLMQVPRTRVVCDHLASGQLVPVLPDWHAGELPLMVLYPRNRHLTAKVRAFADWVKGVFEEEFAAAGRIWETIPAPASPPA